MKKILSFIIILIFLVSLNTPGYSGGFAIYEHGAVAMGMAGCYVALANSPAVIYFNPAGITSLTGTRIYLGTTLIFPSTTFKGPFPLTTTSDMKSNIFYPSNLYLSRSFNEKLSIGFGFFSPFGLGTEWEENWIGRFHIIKSNLQSFFFNPVIAYKIHPKVSIGGGFSYVYSSVTLKKGINTQDAVSMENPKAAFLPYDPYFKNKEGLLDLNGSGTGVGFNIGALFEITDKINIGISYRSSIKISYEGDAKFNLPSQLLIPDETGKPVDIIPMLKAVLKDQKGETEITFPQTIMAGISVKILPQLIAEVDINWVGWSSFKKLPIKLKESKSISSEIDEDYKNAFIYRLGFEYILNDNVSLRLGYIFDSTPCPEKSVSPLLPDANRNEISFGIGFNRNNFIVDTAFQIIMFNDRRNDVDGKLNGLYTSSAKLFGVNFGYSF
ncbi:hypothetical protein DRQ09_10625 [candidate division KSB1 bacterium]|nr:MAG: hypothetical protein DRQ09_10625 [candidate division KSB1 bacterium]